jgi:putative transposase
MRKQKEPVSSFAIDEATGRKAVEQFRTGKPLFGKDGAFGPMLQAFLEAALEGELSAHLSAEGAAEEMDDDPKSGGANRRNGHNSKEMKTGDGSFSLITPRDRRGSFEPQIVKKRETVLADNLEERIIGMYGLGMSLRDISSHLQEMYGTSVSHTTLSEITDRIIPRVREWQHRPLEAVYCIVWLDAMYFKVKDAEGRVVTRCLYNILGIGADGEKQVLGAYVSEAEGARFWLSVLTDLQSRGVQDMLIACIDNLSGFDTAIATVFPKCDVQSCIVHQIRNSLKYVASKDSKEVMADLKPIYQAHTKEEGELALDSLEEKWAKKYGIVVKSWRTNWEKLSAFFKYPPDIRKLIYTTNTIEGYHRQLRKVTKTKGAFPNDMALLKLIYLSSIRIEEKWTNPIKDWGLAANQLSIIFGGRMPITL